MESVLIFLAGFLVALVIASLYTRQIRQSIRANAKFQANRARKSSEDAELICRQRKYIDSLDARNEKLSEDLKRSQDELDNLSQSLSSTRKQFFDEKKKLSDDLIRREQDCVQLQGEVNTLTTKLEALQDEIRQRDDLLLEINRLEQELQDLSKNLDDAERKIQNYRLYNKRLSDDLKKSQDKLKEAEGNLILSRQNFLSEKKKLTDVLNRLKQDCIQQQEKERVLTTNLEILQTELQRRTGLQAEVNRLTQEAEHLKRRLTNAESKLQEYQTTSRLLDQDNHELPKREKLSSLVCLQNRILDLVFKTYWPNAKAVQVPEILQKLGLTLKGLRNSYKSEAQQAVSVSYESNEVRACYMLAYYYPYVAQAKDSINELLQRCPEIRKLLYQDKLSIALLGCGPMPEALAIAKTCCQFRVSPHIEINSLDINSNSWQDAREITKSLIQDSGQRFSFFSDKCVFGGDKKFASQHLEKLRRCQLVIIQNCCNELERDELRLFSSQILDLIEQMPSNSALLMSEFSEYSAAREIMENIRRISRDKNIITISNTKEINTDEEYEEARQPEVLQRNLFRRKNIDLDWEDRIARKRVKYSNYIVYKK